MPDKATETDVFSSVERSSETAVGASFTGSTVIQMDADLTSFPLESIATYVSDSDSVEFSPGVYVSSQPDRLNSPWAAAVASHK